MNNWISVNDKLPENFNYVIAWRGGCYQFWEECEFVDGVFVKRDEHNVVYENVTHWFIPCVPEDAEET